MLSLSYESFLFILMIFLLSYLGVPADLNLIARNGLRGVILPSASCAPVYVARLKDGLR